MLQTFNKLFSVCIFNLNLATQHWELEYFLHKYYFFFVLPIFDLKQLFISATYVS